MEQKNIKASELAYRIGVNSSAISAYRNGRFKAKMDVIDKMARVLEVSADWLNGGNSRMHDIHSDKITIPVVGYVAAGVPIEAIEEILDFEEISPDMVKDGAEYFGLKIKGQSMEPRIKGGDIVIVRVQADVDSGQIAIVSVNGDHATCKKIVKQNTGIWLQPLNPAFEAVFFSNEEIEKKPVTIIGRVIELRAKF